MKLQTICPFCNSFIKESKCSEKMAECLGNPKVNAVRIYGGICKSCFYEINKKGYRFKP